MSGPTPDRPPREKGLGGEGEPEGAVGALGQLDEAVASERVGDAAQPIPAASASKVGKRWRKARYTGMTRSTCCWWSMSSETRTA